MVRTRKNRTNNRGAKHVVQDGNEEPTGGGNGTRNVHAGNDNAAREGEENTNHKDGDHISSN
jgi:hypothetical protein